MDWRRADDLRALLVTCWSRIIPEKRAEILYLILDTYADESVTRILATNFTPVIRRSLAFHLAQAHVSLQSYQEIAHLLRKRLGE